MADSLRGQWRIRLTTPDAASEAHARAAREAAREAWSRGWLPAGRLPRAWLVAVWLFAGWSAVGWPAAACPAAGSTMNVMSAAQPPTRPAVPLSAGRLRAAAIVAGGLWTDIRVVEETGSTNADVLGEARRGAPEGLVLAAEAQTAGRGRLGRTWQSLPGAALTFSVLLRPTSVPQAGRGWVPLLAGVAVAGALRRAVGVDARLKWPNDVLVADAKLAGILAEQAGDAIAVGIGINVRGRPQDLPVATATSLELHGAGETDRTELLAAVLAELETWYRRWSRSGTQGTPAEAGAGGPAEAGAGGPAEAGAGGPAEAGTGGGGLAGGVRGDGGIGYGAAEASGLRSAYLRLSATVGQEVQVWLPGGRQLTGTACDVDGTGRLVLRSATGLIAVSAGDVIHLR